MPPTSLHKQAIQAYIILILNRSICTPFESLEEACGQFNVDLATILAIEESRYLNSRLRVPKAGNLHLAWDFSQELSHHDRFLNMLRVSPLVFDTILTLIEDHPVFQNNSNAPQAPVEDQLAVTLYRMGRYGNGASVEDIACIAGISEGSVLNYTERCFTAIEALHGLFVRRMTSAEKEVEKKWMDKELGFKGMWREGWLMYDGTIVVLYRKMTFSVPFVVYIC